MNAFADTKPDKTPNDDRGLKRVNPSSLEQMQSLANRLGVTVVQLMGAIDEVGTWIPAIERKLSVGMYGSSSQR
jgi:hypothetical protein